ncbi:MAG: WbqC family protein [Candidatus Saccharicenans sp.]
MKAEAMRISFSQPVFLPWGGFFGRLLHSDLMILLDGTQFARGFTFVNRNRLKGPQGEIWVTVPVKKKGLGLQKISQLKIHQPDRWSEKFLGLLKHYYRHSLFFHLTEEALREIICRAGDDFCRLAVSSLKFMAQAFSINREFILQSETQVEGKGSSLLVSLAVKTGASEVILPYLADRHLQMNLFHEAGIKVIFLKYLQEPYPQFWGNFIGNLSALDLWLCCGPQGSRKIAKSSRLIDS